MGLHTQQGVLGNLLILLEGLDKLLTLQGALQLASHHILLEVLHTLQGVQDKLPILPEGLDKLPILPEGLDKLPILLEGLEKLPTLPEGLDNNLQAN